MPAVTGAPYSADQISEHTQTLADGTHITQNRTVEHLYRDSAGRTRTERPMFIGAMTTAQNSSQDVPMLVEINDPVAGVAYFLDAQNHIAHCYTVPAAPQRPPAPNGALAIRRPTPATGSGGGGDARVFSAPAPGTISAPAEAGTVRVHPSPSRNEQLGTQTIEGLIAEGTRFTTTYPAGAVGNDRPFDVVHEMWRSDQLKMVVLSKSEDPRNGENVMRRENVNLVEPDPALFQPPPDYKVVNETETATITFSRP